MPNPDRLLFDDRYRTADAPAPRFPTGAIQQLGYVRREFLIQRIAPRNSIDAFIAQAADVFCRQFIRWMRLVEKHQDLGLFLLTGVFRTRGARLEK